MNDWDEKGEYFCNECKHNYLKGYTEYSRHLEDVYCGCENNFIGIITTNRCGWCDYFEKGDIPKGKNRFYLEDIISYIAEHLDMIEELNSLRKETNNDEF